VNLKFEIVIKYQCF